MRVPHNILGYSFWIYRLGQMVSYVGDQVAFIAIAFYAISQKGAVSGITQVILPANLVGLLASLFLGALADRFSKKKFIVYGNALRAIAWIGIVMFMVMHQLSLINLAILYLVSALGSAVATAGNAAILPELVEAKNVAKGFRIVTGSNALIRIIGGICAGALVGFCGVTISFFMNAMTFVFLCVTAGFMQLRVSQASVTPSAKNLSCFFTRWTKDFMENIQYIYHRSDLLKLAIAIFMIQFLFAPLEIALPFFVKTVLHEQTTLLGNLISAQGIGAVIASIALKYLPDTARKTAVVIFSMLMMGLSILFFGLTQHAFVLLWWMLLIGLSVTTINILLNIALLKFIPEKLRARFFTTLLCIEGAAVPLGIAAANYLIGVMGVVHLFCFLGILLLMLTGIMHYMRVFNILTTPQSVHENLCYASSGGAAS